VGHSCVTVTVHSCVPRVLGVAVVRPRLRGVSKDLVTTVFGLVALLLGAGVPAVLHRVVRAGVGVLAMARLLGVGMVTGVLDAPMPGLVSVLALTVIAVVVTGVVGAVVVRPVRAGMESVVHVGVSGGVHAPVTGVPHPGMTLLAHPGMTLVAHLGMTFMPHPGMTFMPHPGMVAVLVAGPPEQGRRRGARLLVERGTCCCAEQRVECGVEHLADLGAGTDARPVSRLRDLRPEDVDGTGQLLTGSAKDHEQVRLRR
jgi:hypothetical protein